MRSSYADDVDVTTLKTELLAFKQIFEEKASHFDEIQRALEETTLDTRLLFPNVIIVIQLLFKNPATSTSVTRGSFRVKSSRP